LYKRLTRAQGRSRRARSVNVRSGGGRQADGEGVHEFEKDGERMNKATGALWDEVGDSVENGTKRVKEGLGTRLEEGEGEATALGLASKP
jgi:hypothetical protein